MAPDISRLLDELEERIEKLKVEYDRYFLGLERFEPLKQRREVERLVRHLRGQVIANTALKFRFHMLIQRLTTYKQYWDRVQRQIEEGTYRRDLARIQRKLKAQGIKAPDLMKARTATDVEAALAKALGASPTRSTQTARASSRGTATASQPKAKTPPPIPKEAQVLPGKISGRKLREVYEQYLQARKQTGQSTKGLTYDRFVRTVAKALPKVEEMAGGGGKVKEIELTVEIRDGKAKLKAIPKS